MDQIDNQAEIVVIDEAHHFRNRSSNRYRKLFDMMAQGPQKQMFMLTATPINNSFVDLQHLIELFTHRQEDYFAAAPLGIHSLSGHFKRKEQTLNGMLGIAKETLDISDDVIRQDRQAVEYLNWFQPAWDALSEDDRFVLDTFFCSESKYGSGAADAVSDHFSIERSSAYRRKNRALENLTTLLYGRW